MKIFFHTVTCFLILYFMTGGCNKEDLLDKGTFKIKVKGYLNKSFYGEAVFEDVSGLGGTIFFLVLRNIETPGEIYKFVQFTNASRLGIGRYSLMPNNTIHNIVAEYEDSEVEGSFHSIDGILEINSSTNKEVIGWCDFTAETFISLGQGNFQKVNIRVTGEFYAQEGNVGIILGKEYLKSLKK